MESKAKVFGHPLHPILIVVPLGLFTVASIFDALVLLKGRKARGLASEELARLDETNEGAIASPEAVEKVSEAVQGSDDLARAAHLMIGAGVIGGLLAAPPGWIDWFAIPSATRAKRVGLVHGLGNVLVLAMYGLSYLARRDDPSRPAKKALALSFGGWALGGFTGWLGGELVHRLGVSLDEGANLNASDSFADHLHGESSVARRP